MLFRGSFMNALWFHLVLKAHYGNDDFILIIFLWQLQTYWTFCSFRNLLLNVSSQLWGNRRRMFYSSFWWMNWPGSLHWTTFWAKARIMLIKWSTRAQYAPSAMSEWLATFFHAVFSFSRTLISKKKKKKAILF